MARGTGGFSPPKKSKHERIMPLAPTIDEGAARGIATEDPTQGVLKNKKGGEESDYMKAQRGQVTPMFQIPALGASYTNHKAVLVEGEEGRNDIKVEAAEHVGYHSPYMLRIRPLVPVVDVDQASHILRDHTAAKKTNVYMKEFKIRPDSVSFNAMAVATFDERLAAMHPDRKTADRDDASSVGGGGGGGLTTRSAARSKGSSAEQPDALTIDSVDHFTQGLAPDPLLKPQKRGMFGMFRNKPKGRAQRLLSVQERQEQHAKEQEANKMKLIDNDPNRSKWGVMDEESDGSSIESELTTPYTPAPPKRGLVAWLTRANENNEFMRPAMDRENMEVAREELKVSATFRIRTLHFALLPTDCSQLTGIA